MSVHPWDVRMSDTASLLAEEYGRLFGLAWSEFAVAVAWANIRPDFGPLDPVVAYVCQSCGLRSRRYATTRRMNLDGSYRSEIACAGCQGG